MKAMTWDLLMLLHKMKEYVMTTRRTFLKGVGAGLLLPATWDFLANHLEKYGEPLLSAPTPADHTLYAIPLGDDFQLSLDTAEDEMPSLRCLSEILLESVLAAKITGIGIRMTTINR